MLKTYDVKCGTVGILPDGEETMLFPTDEEATEYLREKLKESKENDEDSQ